MSIMAAKIDGFAAGGYDNVDSSSDDLPGDEGCSEKERGQEMGRVAVCHFEKKNKNTTNLRLLRVVAQKKSRKNKNVKVKICKWDLEQEVEIDSCLPGQRYKTPDQREPFRIFLETLYQKLPEDELPASWMMEWGLLPYDEAKKAYERDLTKKLCKMESENNEVEDTRSSLSEKNVDFASRTVSKTKKQKTHNNTPDGAVSEPSSGGNKQQKKKHKVRD